MLDCATSTTTTFLKVIISKKKTLSKLRIYSLFMQLVSSQSFEDVCPLLLNNDERYTQHVQVETDLQLTTRNLPSTVSQNM